MKKLFEISYKSGIVETLRDRLMGRGWNIAFRTLCLVLLTCMAACTEDLDVKEGIRDYVDDSMMTVSFFIPESDHIVTRDDQDQSEMKINNLILLFFDTDGDHLLMRKDVDANTLSTFNGQATNSTNSFSYTFRKDKSLTSGTVYAVANTYFNSKTEDLLADFEVGNTEATVDKLNDITAGHSYDIENGHFMSGKNWVSGNQVSIELRRTSAKLTLQDISHNSKFELLGFTATNTANACYLTAGVSKKIYEGNANTSLVATDENNRRVTNADGSYRFDIYANPTITHKVTEGSVEVSSYIVIKGKYDEEECYYAVALYDSETYYNIERNTWYEMLITQVSGKGYKSEEEALANPFPDKVTVEIHDHVLNVMNMVTDGIREMGTDREIQMSSAGTVTLSLKLFSVNENEIQEIDNPIEAQIIQGSDWLKVDGIEETQLEPTSGHTDEDKPGRQWEYTLKFIDDAKIFTDKSAVIKFEWMGLTREVPVYYSTEFNPERLFNKVIIQYGYKFKDGSPRNEDQNYWSFLKDDVLGNDRDHMANNQHRDRGFHFPMPYGGVNSDSDTDTGDNFDEWDYWYEIEFKDEMEAVTVTTSGDDFFNKNNLEWTFPYGGSKKKGALKYKDYQTKDYTYATGSITFHITSQDIGKVNMTIDLYHTGFFHFQNSLSPGNLYYEVIKLGQDYWLDRNIGATSNKMYVSYDGGFYGEEEAAGGYYKIANTDGNYNSPVILKSMCPKGYHIPTTTEWDRMKNSSSFMSERITDETSKENYITTYYKTENPRVPIVYFPKSRYYNHNTIFNKGVYYYNQEPNTGADASGYYWTCTESSGQEKLQIGKWIKVLNLNGSSSSYINGSIQNHAMNVRCVAGKNAPEEVKYSIDFNVKGATHAYLYSLDADGNKIGVLDFPGKAIGSAAAVRDLNSKDETHYLHFSYRSNDPADYLYVFFAYKNEDGKIVVISNGSEKEYTHSEKPSGDEDMAEVVTQDFNIDSIKGWPVWIGANYFFTWKTSEDGKNLTELEGTNISMGEPLSSGNPQESMVYRIYWPKTCGKGLYLWDFEGYILDWSQSQGCGTVDSEYPDYYYVEVKRANYEIEGYFNYKFSNQAGSGKESAEKMKIPYAGSFKTVQDVNRTLKIGYIKGDLTGDGRLLSPGFPPKESTWKEADIYIRMSINGNWAANKNYQFFEVEKDKKWQTFTNISIKSGTYFKIGDETFGKINLGGKSGNDEIGNDKMYELASGDNPPNLKKVDDITGYAELTIDNNGTYSLTFISDK